MTGPRNPTARAGSPWTAPEEQGSEQHTATGAGRGLPLLGLSTPPPTSESFPSDTSTLRSQSSEDRSTRSPRATQPLPPSFPPGPSLRAGPFSAPLHTPEAPPAGLSPPRLPPHSAHSPSLSLALGTASSSVHILLPPGPTGHPSRPDT